MHRSFLWLFAVTAWAQQTCPVPNFQAAVPLNLTAPVLVHQPDGSYTGIDLSSPPPGQFLGSIPNIGRSLAACIPKAASSKTVVAGLDVVGGISARTASGNYVFAQLNNPQFNQNVAIQTYDSNFNLIFNQSLYMSGASAAFADYNRDGLLDLLVNEAACSVNVGQPCGSLVVFAGKANGSFSTPAMVSQQIGAGAFSVADFNGDGLPDILVPIGPFHAGVMSGSFSILFQRPDHSLGPATQVFSSQDWTARVGIGDLNGDGFPDLVFAPNDGVYVALNDGTGHFPNATAVSAIPGDLAIGDVNGDGHADIVTSGTTVLFGDGHGGFTGRIDYEPIMAPRLFDLDGDGLVDLVGSSSVLFGLVGGKFWGAFASGISNSSPPTLLQADFNGDGIPDVFEWDSYGGASVFIGAGNGMFSVGWSNPKLFVYAAAIADVNGDGKPDLIFAAGSASPQVELYVLLNRGGGSFSDPVITPGVPNIIGLAVGDFNGDGKLDVSAISQAYVDIPAFNGVTVFTGKGDGSFNQGSTTSLSGSPLQVAAADFHGNGHLDLVVAIQGAPPVLLSGKGDGTFSSPVALPLGGPAPSFIVGDFNRDGRPDLVSGSNVLLGQGNGQFLVKLNPNLILYAGGFAVDINADGILDIVSGSNLYLGNGDGTFQSATVLPAAPSLVADFNMDGKPDFIAGSLTYLQANSPNPAFAVVSAVTNTYGPLAPESLATAYGNNLSASVAVTDANGITRAAPVLFASPGQVNFEIPAGVATGQAKVTIAGQTATVPIEPVAPALFTVQYMTNAPLVLGSVVTVAPDGTQTIQPTTEPTLPNGFTNSNPAHLGGAAQAYLIAFGSGFRAASSATVLVGSIFFPTVPAKVAFMGPAPGFIGLDQINIQLPPLTLEGTIVFGVTLYLGVDGIPVNSGTFAITN